MNDVVTEKEKMLFHNARNIVKKYICDSFENCRIDLPKEEKEKMKSKLLSNLETVKLNDEIYSDSNDTIALYDLNEHRISISNKHRNLKDSDLKLIATFAHELFHSMSQKDINPTSYRYSIFEEGFASTFADLVMKYYFDSINYPYIYRYESYTQASDIIKTCLLMEKDKDIELLFRYMTGDLSYFKERIEKLLNKKIYSYITNSNVIYSKKDLDEVEKLAFYELDKKRDKIDLCGKEIYIEYNRICNSLICSNEVDMCINEEEKLKTNNIYGSFSRISRIYENQDDIYLSSRFLELAKSFIKEYKIDVLESICINRIDFIQLIEKNDILNLALDSYVGKDLSKDNLEKIDYVKITEFIEKYVIKYFGKDPMYLKKLGGIYLLIENLEPKELEKIAYADVLVKCFSSSIFSNYMNKLDKELTDEDRRMTIEDLENIKEHFGGLLNYEFNVHTKEELDNPDSSIGVLEILDVWCRHCELGTLSTIRKVWPNIFEIYDGKLFEYANDEYSVRESIRTI